MSKQAELYEQYATGVPINPSKLSAEIADQPTQYFTVFEKANELRSNVDSLKTALDQLLSEIDLQTREELLDEGVKITEGLVSSHVTIDPKVKKAKKALEDAQRDYNQWIALKEAFLQRSIMLRSLAELEIAQMRSTDTVWNAREAMAETRKERMLGAKC